MTNGASAIGAPCEQVPDPTLIAGIKELATALRTDLEWLREGTRLLTLALDWDRSERRKNRLLSGEDIVEAKQWLAKTPDAEEVTELHRDFIKASEENEVAQLDYERMRLQELAEAQRVSADAARRVAKRTMAGLLIAVLLGIMASGLGIWAWLERQTALTATAHAQQALEREREARGFTRQILSSFSDQHLLGEKAYPLLQTFFWPANTALIVCFFGGDEQQKALIRDAASQWTAEISTKLVGFQPCEAQNDQRFRSHVRIAFNREDRSWSLIGSQATNKDIVAPDEPSMALSLQSPLGSDINQHTVLHYFGNALGLADRPMPEFCRNEIDWKYATNALGMPKAQVDYLLFGLNQSNSSDQYDRASVMNTSVPAEFFLKNKKSMCFLLPNVYLSQLDRDAIKVAYDPLTVQPGFNLANVGSPPTRYTAHFRSCPSVTSALDLLCGYERTLSPWTEIDEAFLPEMVGDPRPAAPIGKSQAKGDLTDKTLRAPVEPHFATRLASD
jgi:hypothetical protein